MVPSVDVKVDISDRIGRLRRRYQTETPVISIKRARLFTRKWRETAGDGLPRGGAVGVDGQSGVAACEPGERPCIRAAQAAPEEYGDLIIKVGGYSAYFTELGSEIQNEIISRTEHC